VCVGVGRAVWALLDLCGDGSEEWQSLTGCFCFLGALQCHFVGLLYFSEAEAGGSEAAGAKADLGLGAQLSN
jgi:hypothetical protein